MIYPAVANLKSIHVYIYNIYIYIYPTVAHPITELLLLAPEHLPRQVRAVGVIKRLGSLSLSLLIIMIADCNLHLSERVLLHPVAGHLAARLQRHGVLHELPVQEGDPASQ